MDHAMPPSLSLATSLFLKALPWFYIYIYFLLYTQPPEKDDGYVFQSVRLMSFFFSLHFSCISSLLQSWLLIYSHQHQLWLDRVQKTRQDPTRRNRNNDSSNESIINKRNEEPTFDSLYAIRYIFLITFGHYSRIYILMHIISFFFFLFFSLFLSCVHHYTWIYMVSG